MLFINSLQHIFPVYLRLLKCFVVDLVIAYIIISAIFSRKPVLTPDNSLFKAPKSYPSAGIVNNGWGREVKEQWE